MVFPSVSVKTAQDYDLKEKFDTSGLAPGIYNATAYIVADGENYQVSTLFRIGTLDMEVLNSSKSLVVGGIRKFDFFVKSNWNLDAKDVYAIVTLFKDGSQLSSAKTANYDVPRWAKQPMSAFLDLSDVEPGEYEIQIIVYYEDKQALNKAKILLESSEPSAEEKPQSNLVIILVVVVTILTLLNLLLFMRKKNEKKGTD